MQTHGTVTTSHLLGKKDEGRDHLHIENYFATWIFWPAQVWNGCEGHRSFFQSLPWKLQRMIFWFFSSHYTSSERGRACEAFPYLGYTDISTRRQSETEGWYLKTLRTPQRYFLPNYSSQKIQFIQSTFPASLVCTAAMEKHFLCFLVADFTQGNLAPQLHHRWPWSTADQTACPPCTLPQGCTSKAWMGKRRHSAGIRADLDKKSFLAPDTVGVTRTAKETGFSFLPVAVSWF